MSEPVLIGEMQEGASAFVHIDFLDENDQPRTPSTVRYRIDSYPDDTPIVPETTITPTTSSVDIQVLPAQSAILNDTNESEIHRLTVTFEFTLERIGVKELFYRVRASRFV